MAYGKGEFTSDAIGGRMIDPHTNELLPVNARDRAQRRIANMTSAPVLQARIRETIKALDAQLNEIQAICILPDPADQIGKMRMSKVRADLEAAREPLLAALGLLIKQVPADQHPPTVYDFSQKNGGES